MSLVIHAFSSKQSYDTFVLHQVDWYARSRLDLYNQNLIYCNILQENDVQDVPKQQKSKKSMTFPRVSFAPFGLQQFWDSSDNGSEYIFKQNMN